MSCGELERDIGRAGVDAMGGFWLCMGGARCLGIPIAVLFYSPPAVLHGPAVMATTLPRVYGPSILFLSFISFFPADAGRNRMEVRVRKLYTQLWLGQVGTPPEPAEATGACLLCSLL